MKKTLLALLTLITLLSTGTLPGQDRIEWMDISEMEDAMAREPKPVFFDIYTNWCGWCKRMDATTFKNPEVVAAINDNFYPVKFDAESKEGVKFKGYEFKFVNRGRRGHNELASTLLDNKMSYPSFVALNEKFERITVIQGYQTAADFLPMLTYLGEKHYLRKTWEEYKRTLKGK
jgi:thioredoxin-related protein